MEEQSVTEEEQTEIEDELEKQQQVTDMEL